MGRTPSASAYPEPVLTETKIYDNLFITKHRRSGLKLNGGIVLFTYKRHPYSALVVGEIPRCPDILWLLVSGDSCQNIPVSIKIPPIIRTEPSPASLRVPRSLLVWV